MKRVVRLILVAAGVSALSFYIAFCIADRGASTMLDEDTEPDEPWHLISSNPNNPPMKCRSVSIEDNYWIGKDCHSGKDTVHFIFKSSDVSFAYQKQKP